jgi:hypothetical protein
MELEILSEQLQNIHNSFRWINAGGCGEFAKILGAKLRSENIKFKYVLFSDSTHRSLLESIRNFNNAGDKVNKRNFRIDNDYGIAHIMLYHKGVFIDSEGVHFDIKKTRWGRDFKLSAIISQETLEKWCRQKTWNSMFDRGQLPNIKRKVKQITI